MKKVIGIGNALMDVLVSLESDAVLDKFDLKRGSMSLVDDTMQDKISDSVSNCEKTFSLGGSVGNTIRAMAKFGSSVGFIGKVGNDDMGDKFHGALTELNVEPFILRGVNPSGRCLSLVSKDGERTMVTYLGAAIEMSGAEVTAEFFKGYDYIHIEGYLVQDHNLILQTAKLAKKCGLKISIDLASFNVVEENLEFLQMLVHDYVDILFANEDETKAFTGESDPEAGLESISAMCEITVVKVGLGGAYIKCGDDKLHVGILEAAKRVDTTGAGDYYAAGFLAGLCEGLTLRECGTLGAIAAGKVIEVIGTTFDESVWEEILVMKNRVKEEGFLF